MIFARLFKRGEAGVTLVETLVALAITGFIGLGATIASAQVLASTSKNSNYTAASRNVMNAVHWISQDAQMAQSYSGELGFPETSNLTLSWVEWDNTPNTVAYVVSNGSLTRYYTHGADLVRTRIAEFITSDRDTTNATSANGTLMITITASIGQGVQTVNVTKTREITSRPKL